MFVSTDENVKECYSRRLHKVSVSFLACISEFKAAGGQFCFQPSSNSYMESSFEQEPIKK